MDGFVNFFLGVFFIFSAFIQNLSENVCDFYNFSNFSGKQNEH